MKILIVLSLMLSFGAFSKEMSINKGKSSVSFEIVKFKIKTMVEGKFNDFNATMKSDNGMISDLKATIKTESIDTSEPDRDKHLRSPDFFDANGHPEIVFMQTEPAKVAKSFNIKGKLTMKGTTKDVVMAVNQVQDNVYQGQLKINRNEYGVSWNKPLGFSVEVLGLVGDKVIGDDVTVKVLANFNN